MSPIEPRPVIALIMNSTYVKLCPAVGATDICNKAVLLLNGGLCSAKATIYSAQSTTLV